MALRTDTQSIESDVEPDVIFSVLADPARLPQWAPAFADKVSAARRINGRSQRDAVRFSSKLSPFLQPAPSTICVRSRPARREERPFVFWRCSAAEASP
jgi:hypothetical protein